MKNLAKKMFKSNFVKLAKNQRGQGMLEYILLVVVIVGLIVVAKPFFNQKFEEIKLKLGDSIGGVLGG